jgi:hypothetical protein
VNAHEKTHEELMSLTQPLMDAINGQLGHIANLYVPLMEQWIASDGVPVFPIVCNLCGAAPIGEVRLVDDSYYVWGCKSKDVDGARELRSQSGARVRRDDVLAGRWVYEQESAEIEQQIRNATAGRRVWPLPHHFALVVGDLVSEYGFSLTQKRDELFLIGECRRGTHKYVYPATMVLDRVEAHRATFGIGPRARGPAPVRVTAEHLVTPRDEAQRTLESLPTHPAGVRVCRGPREFGSSP